MTRNQATPEIIRLLKEHDSIAYDNRTLRNTIKRKILFIMETVKLEEREST